MITLLAATMFAAVQLGQWGLKDIAIAIVITAGIVGVVYVVLRALGIVPPEYVKHLFWIVVLVCLGILAIRIISSM